MKLISGLIGLLVYFMNLNEKVHESPIAHFIVADTIITGIQANYDSLGLPDNYQAHISTPVCEVDKCYSIEIYFYWDLIGRFDHYDTIPGFGLTKLDHQPFSSSDFIQLEYILKNQDSPLAEYTKEELTRNTRTSEIDGLTGATIKEIKESVIGGAVYSCHTLWHIANGSVVDSIQKATTKSLSEALVKKLVNQEDLKINYFLIDSFSETDFEKYLPEVLRTLKRTEGYYAKNAIEKIPKELYSNSLAQEFFASNFNQFNYFTQVALLKKLTGTDLNEGLIRTLKMEMNDRDSYKNELIQQILGEG